MNVPTSRELRNPYFLLRTPDGIGSYIKRDSLRLLLSEREPLSAFLAPIRNAAEGKGGSIEYNLEGLPLDTFEPLDALPAPLQAAFSEAVDAFLDKGDEQGSRISDHEKRLRQGFRLPDPDLEKDAYWLYGPIDDRKLLILWGCEFRQNTSLPLRTSSDGKPGVREKLASRTPTWRQTQDAAVRLIREKGLALAPFLGTASVNASGKTDGYMVGGKKLPASECHPIGKIPEAALNAYRTAVEEFYSRALPDSAASDYERDLIRSFQLPDPNLLKERYRQHKDSFFIVLDGKETEDQCLHPAADVRIGIPEPRKTEDGITHVPDTVADRLEQRKAPVRSKPILAGAAVALAVIVAGLFWLLADRTPPEVTEVIATDDPEIVEVVFSEALHPDSVVPREESPAPFRIRHERGHYIEVAHAALVPDSPHIVRLHVEPLEERPYTLLIRGVTDRARARNVIEGPVEKSFSYRDTIPPRIEHVSAHPDNPRKILVRFTRELDPSSANNPAAFRIPGFTVRSAELEDDSRTVAVATEQPFEHRREYTLSVQNVRDASRERNPIAEGASLAFEYRDTVPPAIERVGAESNQVTVRLHFTKTLDRNTAETPAHYTILQIPGDDSGETSPLEVRAARLLPDSRTVDLVTAPMDNGITYHLTATGIRDRADPPNTLESVEPIEFLFRGAVDRNPPRILSVQFPENDRLNLIIVTFDKPVEADSAIQPAAYRVEHSPATVEKAEPTGDPTQVALRLTEPLLPTDRHRILVEGVTDMLGNRIESESRSPQFSVPGTLYLSNDLVLLNATPENGGERITLTFQDALLPETARNPANYRLTGNVRISRVELADNDEPEEITLVLDPATPLATGTYRVTVRNQRLALIPDARQADVSLEFRY